jgi:long-chain fatty acid transport protein
MYFSYTLPSGWGFGVGLYAPFGLGVKWENPTTWIGRTTNYDVHLGTFYVTPAAAYKINEQWSVALGADIAWQWIELNRFDAIPFGGNSSLLNTVDVKLEGTSDLNVTPSAGIMFRPNEKWSFGVMYHHKKTFKYSDGDGTLKNVVPADDPGLAAVRAEIDDRISLLGGPTHKIATEIRIPYILSLGARYQVHPRATLEFNAVHWSWSEFDQIDLVFDGNTESPLNETILERYEDRWQIRFGLEADLGKQWRGMLGYIHDKTPQPVESMGPLLPDATRNDFSLGAQYDYKRWSFIGTYLFVLNNERSTVQNGQVTYFNDASDDEIATRRLEAGTYKAIGHIFGVGVNYNF